MRLVNDPDWIRYIGDRGVRTEDDARAYLERGPIAMYARQGFGLWRVARRDDDEPVGMCGLIKRDTLPDVDIGFAFLPAYRGLGYAAEAAAATLALASTRYGLTRVVAIASPDNDRSLRAPGEARHDVGRDDRRRRSGRSDRAVRDRPRAAMMLFKALGVVLAIYTTYAAFRGEVYARSELDRPVRSRAPTSRAISGSSSRSTSVSPSPLLTVF